MIENLRDESSGAIPCPDGQHDFEKLPVADGWGILVGHSRCRKCLTIADELKVDGLRPVEPRPTYEERRNARS